MAWQSRSAQGTDVEKAGARLGATITPAGIGEEVGLHGGYDDEVEEVGPLHAAGQEGVVGYTHQLLRIDPVGVGDEAELLARRALVEERARERGIAVDETCRVGHHLLLERALHVRLEERAWHEVAR